MARDSLTVFILESRISGEQEPRISMNGVKGNYQLNHITSYVEENKWDILIGPKVIVEWSK